MQWWILSLLYWRVVFIIGSMALNYCVGIALQGRGRTGDGDGDGGGQKGQAEDGPVCDRDAAPQLVV
jgi:hypothetical protein